MGSGQSSHLPNPLVVYFAHSHTRSQIESLLVDYMLKVI